jgi:Tfp pilus assembly protein PilO
MYKNLSASVAASNGTPFIIRPGQTALDRSKQMSMALLGTFGLIFAVGAGLAYLLFSQISRSETDVMNLQAQAGSSAQITKRYESTMQSYNDTVGKLSFLEASVAANQYVPTLLQQLQTLAQAAHLQVTSFKPGPLASTTVKPATANPAPAAGASGAAANPAKPAKVAAPPYDTLPVQLTVTGTFREVMTFIYSLPRFPKILCLTGVSLTPASGPAPTGKLVSTEPNLTASLKINAYIFGPSNSAVAATPAAPALGSFSAAHSSINDIEGQINAAKPVDGAPVASANGPAAASTPGPSK